MIHNITQKISLGILISLIPTLVAAQTEKDWTLVKRIDPGLGVMTCTAMTASAESKIPVQAEVILPEGDEKAPLLLVKAKGLNGQVANAYVRPDAKTAYKMLLLNSDAQTGEDTYVLSPLRLNETVKIIIEKAKLDIYFGEGATSILARVSLKGSSVTLNRAAACRTSKQLLNQALLSELQAGADAVPAQEGDLASFLAAYQEVLNKINKRSAVQAELSAAQKVSEKLKAQLTTAQNSVATAVRNEQATILEINKLKTKISDLQAALAKAQADLPGLQAARPQAVQDVKNAEAAVAPHQSQIDRLENEIEIAQRDLSAANNNVANLQNSISSLERQIRDLEAQTDQLRRDQETKRRQVMDIKNQRSRLQSEYNLFDEHRRAEEILRSNSSYQSELRDLERNIRRRQELPNEVEIARSRVIEAQRALEQCRAQQPPADCSAQVSAHQRFVREFESKRSELQNIDAAIERNRARIRDHENDATRRARDEKNEILRRIDQLDNQISDLDNQIAEIDRRIRDIQGIDLPRLQRQLDSQRQQLSSAQNQVTSASQRVRQAQSDLARYKQSVGYDQLEANLARAESKLDSLDRQISAAQKTIQQAPGQITSAQSSLQAQEQELVRRTQIRVDAEGVMAQAQKAVDAQLAVEGEIKSRLSAAQAEVITEKTKVQALSKGLFGI